MYFNLTNRDGATTLSVVGDRLNEVIPDTHPYFTKIRDYLLSNPQHDEEYVARWVNPATAISESLAEVTDRLTYEHNNLWFDGAALHNALGRHILRMIENGDNDWGRFVKFLINLDANPSYRCQQAVYKWVSDNGLTITEDGNFIGYKGVQENGFSLSSGPNNYINGEIYQNGASTNVPHEIGTVISKKRAEVNDDPRLACSVGLHVGTKTYATDFGPRLLTVEINPADVVSIPDSDLEWKIRVCKYKVVALADEKQFSSTSWSPSEVEGGTEEETLEDDTSLVEAMDDGGREGETIAVSFDGSPVSERLTVPQKDDPTLADWAEVNRILLDDLMDSTLGHKPLARKWADITTESSVRRWRKSNGITLTLATKVKDSLTS